MKTAYETTIESLISTGHQLYHAGNLGGAYKNWHEATMARWAFCKREGFDILQTRVLSHFWVLNIGHFLFLDAYIKLSRLGVIDTKNICLILDKKSRIGNSHLLELFKEHLSIRIVDESQYLNSFRSLLFWLREDLDYIRINDTCGMSLPAATVLAQKKWAEAGLPPLIHTNAEMDSVGESFLRKHGIAAGDWYVCLHARGPGYNGPSRRDCEFSDYQQLIERMIGWGAKVIRMGDSRMSPAPAVEGLIDYAVTPEKDPRIDIYLISHCRFFVGCTSGPAALTALFAVPCICVNWAPMGSRPPHPEDYFLPKLYRCLDSQRILSIQEVTGRGLDHVELPEAVHRQKLNIVDNTPEQITEAVTYFFKHIIQGKPLSPEDVQMQKNYSDALDKSGVVGGGLVIPDFARQYPETWSLNSAEDAKASIAAPRSVTLSSCPLNAPDYMTPAQLEGVLTSTAGEMEQVLQQALEHHQSTLLRQAMEHHRAARLAEAAILYEHILRADVPHPDALHLLGQIYLQQGAVDQAETRFAQAIAVRPDVAAYSLNHGLALHRLGRDSEALAAFIRAQALDPTLSEAHHQAGNVLKSLGRHGEAIMALREAVRLVRSRSPVSARHHDVTVVQSSSLS